LRAGVSQVRLVSGATLVDASATNRALPLVTEGQTHAALVTGPGSFVLTLEWGAPLKLSPGRASFILPVPQAERHVPRLTSPAEQADVRLSAGLITAGLH
jgi:hypothetical protein